MRRLQLAILAMLAVTAVGALGSASASAHEFLKNGSPITGSEPVLTISTSLILLSTSSKKIDCEKAHGLILILASGRTWIHFLHFLNCKPSQANCLVHSPGASNGLILLINIPDELVLREPSGGGTAKLADEFKANPSTGEFITLQFELENGTACSEFPETKVEGQVAGLETNNPNSVEFLEPELKGNSLKAFGKAAKFTGTFENKLVNGGTLEAI